jgi:hypothetical protein
VLSHYNGPPSGSGTLEDNPRWQLARRVAGSKTFAGSQPLQSFLLYISERTLNGQGEQVKEQTIGTAVFHRRPDYDPGSDNIVRVRAGQLRQRLARYFDTEGEAEPLVITIPKGGYVPVFEPRPAQQPVAAPPEPAAPATSTPLPEARLDRAPPRQRVWPYWAAIVTLAGVALFFALRPEPVAVNPTLSKDTRQVWAPMFRDSGDLEVVLGDLTYSLWQDLADRNLTLADYVGMKFLNYSPPELRETLNEVASRRYTSVADANLASKIPVVAASFGRQTRLRFARHMDVHDLSGGSVILVGSRRANPWVELFESRLQYAFGYNTETHRPFFENKSPKPGESPILSRGNDPLRDTYAVVAMFPHPSGKGHILIIEGLSMEGTDAAGEFLLNPQSCDLLARRMRSELGGTDKPFEALLRLTPVAGGSANARLVSLHAIRTD